MKKLIVVFGLVLMLGMVVATPTIYDIMRGMSEEPTKQEVLGLFEACATIDMENIQLRDELLEMEGWEPRRTCGNGPAPVYITVSEPAQCGLQFDCNNDGVVNPLDIGPCQTQLKEILVG